MSTEPRPEIRILEEHVVNQIAAGEVVERPASVVKELVENALDARATHVDVTLREGGTTLIQVSDDGIGLTRQDALMCIESHATSKIRGVSDLEALGSFGFRGEALPSIAAVCRFELVSRTADADQAVQLRVDGGTLVDVQPAAGAPGTVVRVRNLFYNLPARRAFLRAPSTELGHCVQAVVRTALGRPDVGFTLNHGGRRLVDAPIAEDVATRAVHVLGPDAKRLVAIHETSGPLVLSGLAAPPGLHRSTNHGSTYLFVNGRWVRDLVLRRAVQQAYRDLLPRGRHPMVVLDLSLPGSGVDVNVHPTKAEVRFRDPVSVGNFVSATLRSAVLDSVGVADPRQGRGTGFDRRGDGPTPLPFDVTQVTPVRPAPSVLPPPAAPTPSPAGAPSPGALPSVSPLSVSPPSIPALPEPLVVAEPQATTEREPLARILGVIGDRYAVGDHEGSLWLVDLGRLARRTEAARAEGPGRRLLVPTVCRLTEADVDRLMEAVDTLGTFGLDVTRFSSTEVAVRAVPPSLARVAPEALVTVAVSALAAGMDLVSAWGDGLPPAPVEADEVSVRTVLATAREVGIPVGARHIPPATLLGD